MYNLFAVYAFCFVLNFEVEVDEYDRNFQTNTLVSSPTIYHLAVTTALTADDGSPSVEVMPGAAVEDVCDCVGASAVDDGDGVWTDAEVVSACVDTAYVGIGAGAGAATGAEITCRGVDAAPPTVVAVVEVAAAAAAR